MKDKNEIGKGKLTNARLGRAEDLPEEVRKKHNLPDRGMVVIETRVKPDERATPSQDDIKQRLENDFGIDSEWTGCLSQKDAEIFEDVLRTHYKNSDSKSCPCWQCIIEAISKTRADGLSKDKFYQHIKNHFAKEHPDWKVMCKICGKTYEEIMGETPKQDTPTITPAKLLVICGKCGQEMEDRGIEKRKEELDDAGKLSRKEETFRVFECSERDYAYQRRSDEHAKVLIKEEGLKGSNPPTIQEVREVIKRQEEAAVKTERYWAEKKGDPNAEHNKTYSGGRADAYTDLLEILKTKFEAETFTMCCPYCGATGFFKDGAEQIPSNCLKCGKGDKPWIEISKFKQKRVEKR